MRVQAMQEEYLKYINSGRTTIYIYRTYIYPKFLISRATFYNWLAIAPKKELEKLKRAEEERSGKTDKASPKQASCLSVS